MDKFLVEVIAVFLWGACLSVEANNDVLGPVYKENVFHWFAYDTYIYAKRVHQLNLDATLVGPAMLKDHRLDFTTVTREWNGALATVSKEPRSMVWGVVWTIKWADKNKLDEYIGVNKGLFHSVETVVTTKDGMDLDVFTYIQNHSPRRLQTYETPTPDRIPSATYVRAMILAAVQSGIPSEYIRYLYTLTTNGKQASPEILKTLGTPFANPPKKHDTIITYVS